MTCDREPSSEIITAINPNSKLSTVPPHLVGGRARCYNSFAIAHMSSCRLLDQRTRREAIAGHMVRSRITTANLNDYAVAVGTSLIAATLALVLSPQIPAIPFILSILAVLISALYGGRGPGLLATVIGALVSAYLTVPSAATPGLTASENLLWFGLTVLIMFLISSLNSVRKRGQEALLRLAAIVETSDDAIIGQELDGTIVSWNSGAERLYGYTAREVIGRPSSILVPPERVAEMSQTLELLARGGHLYHFETRHQRKDGQAIDVSLAISQITRARGDVVGLSTIARDITWSKKAQAERERLLEREQAAREQAEAIAERLSAIQTVTDAALAHLPLDDLLRELLNRIRAVLSGDVATILLLTEDGSSFAVRASAGVEGKASEAVQVPIGSGLASRIVTRNEPIVIEDLSASEEAMPLFSQQSGSLIAVPLHVEGRVIGLAHVGSLRPRLFSEDDVQLLERVAVRAASAIDRARLFDEVSAGVRRLQILSKQLMEAQESERRHIAIELHDEIGQALTAVKINLQAAQRMLLAPAQLQAQPSGASAQGMVREGASFGESGRLDQSLKSSIALIEQTLQQVRNLSLDLRPSVLDDLGLVAALRWYVDRVSQQTGLAAEFKSDSVEGRLAPEIEIACFRLVQESLTNISRHARANHILVELRQDNEVIGLSIRDDGVGFDVDAARERAVHGGSLGLLGMQERALAAGGELEIRSAPGGGAEISAFFPVSRLEPRQA
jgi:PAS domain S-box-containing protein